MESENSGTDHQGLFRRFIARWGFGADDSSTCLPVLYFPACVFAYEMWKFFGTQGSALQGNMRRGWTSMEVLTT